MGYRIRNVRNILGSKLGWELAFLIGSLHFLQENNGIVTSLHHGQDKMYSEMFFGLCSLLDLMPTCVTYGMSFPDSFQETDFSIVDELRSVFIRIVLLYDGF
jgi:hypothetical protein